MSGRLARVWPKLSVSARDQERCGVPQRVIDEVSVPGLNRREAGVPEYKNHAGSVPGRSLFPMGRHCRADGHLDTPAHRVERVLLQPVDC